MNEDELKEMKEETEPWDVEEIILLFDNDLKNILDVLSNNIPIGLYYHIIGEWGMDFIAARHKDAYINALQRHADSEAYYNKILKGRVEELKQLNEMMKK